MSASRAIEARALSERERHENLARSSRARAEALEREMRSSAGTTRKLQQALLMMRRGVVGAALGTALTRGDELALSAAVGRWRWLVETGIWLLDAIGGE